MAKMAFKVVAYAAAQVGTARRHGKAVQGRRSYRTEEER